MASAFVRYYTCVRVAMYAAVRIPLEAPANAWSDSYLPIDIEKASDEYAKPLGRGRLPPAENLTKG